VKVAAVPVLAPVTASLFCQVGYSFGGKVVVGRVVVTGAVLTSCVVLGTDSVVVASVVSVVVTRLDSDSWGLEVSSVSILKIEQAGKKAKHKHKGKANRAFFI